MPVRAAEADDDQADAGKGPEHHLGGTLGGRPVGVSRIEVIQLFVFRLQCLAHPELDQAKDPQADGEEADDALDAGGQTQLKRR